MTTYLYQSQAAITPTGVLTAEGSGQIFAIDDVAYTTPLVVRDPVGNNMTEVPVSPIGQTSVFYIDDHPEVWWVSGGIPSHLVSWSSILESATASAASAQAAREAAEVAAALVEAPTDEVAARLVTDVQTLTGAAILERFTSFVATAVRDSEPMTKWAAALASAGSSPAQVVAFGDSITEGTGATTVANRWQTLMQTALRDGAVGAQFPFIPAWPMTSAPGTPVVRAGNVGQNSTSTGTGLGWRGIDLRDDTASLTFTFTGDRCKVMYFASSGGGIMSVTIDGGTPVLVSQKVPDAPGGNQAWDSGALTAGVHTVVIRRSATSVAGNFVYVQGLLTYNGDLTSHVRVLDAARHGANTSLLTAARTSAAGLSLAAAGGAKLAIIGYGTNDFGLIPVADFRANIDRLIAGLRAGGFTGSILLLGMYLGGGRDNDAWSVYMDEYAAIAAADPDVYYLDLRDYMPAVPTPSTDPSGLGYYNDSLHPNDLGYARMAKILTARLKGAGTMELLALRAAV